MAVSESGSWKLLIYPIIVILILGITINFFVKPFVDAGVPAPTNPNPLLNTARSLLLTGTPFGEVNTSAANNTVAKVTIITLILNPIFIIPSLIYQFVIPAPLLEFFDTELNAISYLPVIMQDFILTIVTISVGYALYVLVAMVVS